MKKLVLLMVMINLCLAADISTKAVAVDGNITGEYHSAPALSGRTFIAQVGDTRTILGPQGKNIVVCEDGDVIAVMYGGPSDPYNATQPFGTVGIAYSLDYGATWATYGPFNSTTPLRRIYPGLDGTPTFCTDAGQAFFVWQEGPSGYATNPGMTMIEENTPDAPSFSSPVELPGNMFPWNMCIIVNPENPLNLLVTASSGPSGGDLNLYAWTSNDGGYTWSDPIPVHSAIGGNIMPGHARFGTGNYVFHTFHDTWNGVEWPFFNESTDGGQTWSVAETLPALSAVNIWWHELDCEVINDMPFVTHNDLDATGFLQLFYPDPNNPGSIGAWNWVALNIDVVGAGETYHDTTWTMVPIQYSSVCYEPIKGYILITYKCGYTISPASPQWPDGNYLGGIVSYDGGLTWKATRPLSGPLLQATGGSVESAHRLVTINDTTWVYSTWEDASDGVAGNQYFERGIVAAMNLDAIAENGNIDAVNTSPLDIFPSISRGDCKASFSVSAACYVTIGIYDVSGRYVETAFEGQVNQGEKTVNLNTSNLPNGVYIATLKTNANTTSAKFVVAQ